MVEILWKTDDTCGPLKELGFYELRLVDLGAYEKPRFLLGEFHAYWSETHQQVIWDGCEEEMCGTPEESKRRYENRRAAIVEKGFMRSEVESNTVS